MALGRWCWQLEQGRALIVTGRARRSPQASSERTTEPALAALRSLDNVLNPLREGVSGQSNERDHIWVAIQLAVTVMGFPCP
jgi:hypothetical protein